MTSNGPTARATGEAERAKKFVRDTTQWVQDASGERFLEHVTARLPVGGVRPVGKRWTTWVYAQRAGGRFASAGSAMQRVENLYAARLLDRHRSLSGKAR